jgi:hypothetical protein
MSNTPVPPLHYELLDRYLSAIRRHLPAGRQHDIVSELAGNLQAEFDDRAESLGRGLTEEEQAEILRRHGHPMLVAARYHPHRSLIGPELFPFYRFTVRRVVPLVIGVSLLAQAAVVIFVNQGSMGQRIHVGGIFAGVFNAVFISLAIITAIFAALDWLKDHPKLKLRQQLDHPDWNPRRLPKADPSLPPHASPSPRHPYADAIASAVFMAWLLALPRFPVLLFGPYMLWHLFNLNLPLIWRQVYWVIVAFYSVQFAVRLALLYRPLRRYFHVFDTLLHLLAIGLLIYVLRVHDYVGLTNFGDSTLAPATAATINTSIHQGLLVVLLMAIGKLVWDTYQWLRPQPVAQIASQQKKPA